MSGAVRPKEADPEWLRQNQLGKMRHSLHGILSDGGTGTDDKIDRIMGLLVRCTKADPAADRMLEEEIACAWAHGRPPASIPLYLKRGKMNSLQFLRKHYQPYLEAGVLFQFQLKEMDKGLYDALRGYFNARPDQGRLADLIPQKTRFVEKEMSKVVASASPAFSVTTPNPKNRIRSRQLRLAAADAA